jgi:hypothetical protein
MKGQTLLNQYLLAKPTLASLYGIDCLDHDQGRGVSVAEVRSSIRGIHACSALAVNTQDILREGG